MKFGYELEQHVKQQDPEWQPYYIDYHTLKRLIREVTTSRSSLLATVDPTLPSDIRPSVAAALVAADAERNFVQTLDQQLKRVSGFFLDKENQYAAQLATLQIRLEVLLMAQNITPAKTYDGIVKQIKNAYPEKTDMATVSSLIDDYRELATRLVTLLRFVEMNATGLRKILKKHDKRIATPDQSMTKWYLTTRQHHPGAYLDIYNTDRHTTHIADDVSDALQALAQLKRRRLSYERRDALHSMKNGNGTSSIHFLSSPSNQRTFISQSTRDVTLVLEEAKNRVERATSFLSFFVDYLAQQAIPEKVSSEEDTEEETSPIEPHHRIIKPKSLRVHYLPATSMSLRINAVSTFLFMMNYYIVVPTCGEYVHMLRAPPFFSGLVVGLLPLAAIVSAFWYSWWSSRTYKSPLLLSALLLCIGNGFYAMAKSFDSIWILLIGRLLCGCGGCRVLNRRFIADGVTDLNRTKEFAAFVAAGCLGMAAGPFGTTVLGWCAFSVGGITVDQITGPGWVMCLAWLLFMIWTITSFTDLERVTQAMTPSVMPRALTIAPNSSLLHHSHSNGHYSSIQSEDDMDHEMDVTIDTGIKVVVPKPGSQRSSRIGSWSDVTDDEHSKSSVPLLSRPKTVPILHQHHRTPAAQAQALVTSLQPMMICLYLLFVGKVVNGAFETSLSMFCVKYLTWSTATVGIFMAVLGLGVLPINYAVGWISAKGWMSPLSLLFWSQILYLLGIFGILIYSFHDWLDIQYVMGSILLFTCLQIEEGINLAILSQKIPPSMRSGLFNSGFLATEAGTFGRALGSMTVSAAAYMTTHGVADPEIVLLPPDAVPVQGPSHRTDAVINFENVTFGPLIFLTLSAIILTRMKWKQLRTSSANEA